MAALELGGESHRRGPQSTKLVPRAPSNKARAFHGGKFQIMLNPPDPLASWVCEDLLGSCWVILGNFDPVWGPQSTKLVPTGHCPEPHPTKIGPFRGKLSESCWIHLIHLKSSHVCVDLFGSIRFLFSLVRTNLEKVMKYQKWYFQWIVLVFIYVVADMILVGVSIWEALLGFIAKSPKLSWWLFGFEQEYKLNWQSRRTQCQ